MTPTPKASAQAKPTAPKPTAPKPTAKAPAQQLKSVKKTANETAALELLPNNPTPLCIVLFAFIFFIFLTCIFKP